MMDGNTLRFVILCCAIISGACQTPPPTDRPLPTLVPLPGELSSPPRLLDYWQSEQDALEGIAEADIWQFVGRGGERIRVRTVSEGLAIVLTLIADDGAILAQGSEILATLPRDGAYSVRVQLAAPAAGPYEIGLSYDDRPNPNQPQATDLPQVVGVPTPTAAYRGEGVFVQTLDGINQVDGTLTESALAHLYTFNGRGGQFVTIEMRRLSGTIDPVLFLYGPDGAGIAMDDNSGGGRAALLQNIILPQDGLYTIQASGDGFFGDYQLTLDLSDLYRAVTPGASIASTPTPPPLLLQPTLGPAVEGQRLEDHVPVAGLITRGGFNRHSFFAPAGATVTVNVQPVGDPPLRPQVEVYDPEGALMASARGSASGNAFIAPFNTPLEGAYLVFVTSEDNSFGEYVISYGLGPTHREVYRGLAQPNTQTNGVIESAGLRDVWQANLRVGDIITVAASPGDAAFDPLIEVALADGTVLAADDNSGGGRAALISGVEIAQSGPYLLRVRDARGAASGAYTLVWRYINLAPTPTPIPNALPILSVDDVVGDNAYQFYIFQGRAGQRVRISVLAKPGGRLDPVAALLGPDGQVLAEADDSPSDLNPRFEFTLPADGTYTVRVNGYLTSGAFDLLVEWLF